MRRRQLKSQLLGRPEQEPSAEFSIPGYGAYETEDGRWIYLVMLSDEHWRRFCQATGLQADPELASLRQRRAARPQVEELVRTVVHSHKYDALAQKLSSYGIGFSEVLSLDRVLDAPQAQIPGKCSDFDFSEYRFRSPNLPFPSHIKGHGLDAPPPLLGEHTKEMLADLGYSEDQIERLSASNITLQSDRVKPPRPDKSG